MKLGNIPIYTTLFIGNEFIKMSITLDCTNYIPKIVWKLVHIKLWSEKRIKCYMPIFVPQKIWNQWANLFIASLYTLSRTFSKIICYKTIQRWANIPYNVLSFMPLSYYRWYIPRVHVILGSGTTSKVAPFCPSCSHYLW